MTTRMKRLTYFLDTLEDIQEFRDQFYGNVLAELAARISAQTAAVQERFQWAVQANEIWRDLLRWANRSADHERSDRDPDREDPHKS
jgi:hypothetical protein